MPVILVVDDTPQNVKLLSDLLSVKGYQVCTAANGEEALAQVAKEKPDLVLLDVMMPGMSGYEVCRRIRADPKTARGIVRVDRYPVLSEKFGEALMGGGLALAPHQASRDGDIEAVPRQPRQAVDGGLPRVGAALLLSPLMHEKTVPSARVISVQVFIVSSSAARSVSMPDERFFIRAARSAESRPSGRAGRRRQAVCPPIRFLGHRYRTDMACRIARST